MWLGKAFIERTKPETLMNPRRDNLLHRALDLADDFHKALRQPGEKISADAAAEIATSFQANFMTINLQALKTEVELAWKLASQQPPSRESKPTTGATRRDGRRNTVPGDAAEKILTALCHYHQLDDSRGFNWEPSTFTDLAKLADVAKGSVTKFFKDRLELGPNRQPHHGYLGLIRSRSLEQKLRNWRGESLRQ